MNFFSRTFCRHDGAMQKTDGSLGRDSIQRDLCEVRVAAIIPPPPILSPDSVCRRCLFCYIRPGGRDPSLSSGMVPSTLTVEGPARRKNSLSAGTRLAQVPERARSTVTVPSIIPSNFFPPLLPFLSICTSDSLSLQRSRSKESRTTVRKMSNATSND